MADRFQNGAVDNMPIAADDPQGWHGGDIQGAIANLDRLQALGVHTLWLTPLTASRQEPFHEWGAYHGYWPQSLIEIEPRFGDWEDLEQLQHALKKRDMSLMLDMVYNHVAFDSPLLETHPEWFHSPAPITDWENLDQVRNGQVHGLPDLAQENPALSEYLIDATILWLQKTGAESIRVDAVRHIDPNFIRSLKAAIQKRHPTQVELVGEIFEGNAATLAQNWRETEVDRVFDFPLYYALMDTVCEGENVGRLGSVLSLDRLYDNPQGLVTFLDNHDLPRLGSKCTNEEAEAALWLLATLRGSPAVTWGTEGLSPGEEEPQNRQVLGKAIDDENTLSMVRKSLLFRANNPVFQNGLTRILFLDEKLLVFLRIHEDQAAIVGFSSGAHNSITLPAWMQDWPVQSEVGNMDIKGGKVLFTTSGTSITLFQAHSKIADQYQKMKTETASPIYRTVQIAGENDQFLSGAGPELGNWTTDGSHAFVEGIISVDFPVHQVMSFKRYSLKNGQAFWDQSQNQSTLVLPGASVLEVPTPKKVTP
jgi:glycosidase